MEVIGEQEKEIYKAVAHCIIAPGKWGRHPQVIACIEEMSELTHEFTKYLNREHYDERASALTDAAIAEEMADVLIMLEQIQVMFNIEDAVFREKCAKLMKLKQRIYEENKNE